MQNKWLRRRELVNKKNDTHQDNQPQELQPQNPLLRAISSVTMQTHSDTNLAGQCCLRSKRAPPGGMTNPSQSHANKKSSEYSPIMGNSPPA